MLLTPLLLALLPCSGLPMPEGRCLEPATSIVEKPLRHTLSRTRAKELNQKRRAEAISRAAVPPPLPLPAGRGAKKGELLQVAHEGRDHFFGVQISLENTATGEKLSMITNEESERPRIAPGTYKLLTEASRKGFPQEAKYQVVDVKSDTVVEEFVKSHVPVNNIGVKAGQTIRVVVLPAVRPYNSVFYDLVDTPVAHIFTRPYPNDGFEPGEFNGSEQFSSTQIAIAFLGMKAEKESPKLAEQIRKRGDDPVLVLGVRAVAADLARTFVEKRDSSSEDYRGHNHVTFLIERNEEGKLPEALLTMSEKDLAAEFERRILWMERHNVHRPQEGGGYAGKTFLEVLEEGKEKALRWPVVSYQSTELLRKNFETLDQTGLTNLVKAIRRERMHYETYEADWLKDVRALMNSTISERLTLLQNWEHDALKRLEKIAPGVTID